MAGDRLRVFFPADASLSGDFSPLPSGFTRHFQLTGPFEFSLEASPVITGGYAGLGQRRPPKPSFEFDFEH